MVTGSQNPRSDRTQAARALSVSGDLYLVLYAIMAGTALIAYCTDPTHASVWPVLTFGVPVLVFGPVRLFRMAAVSRYDRRVRRILLWVLAFIAGWFGLATLGVVNERLKWPDTSPLMIVFVTLFVVLVTIGWVACFSVMAGAISAMQPERPEPRGPETPHSGGKP